MNIDENVQKLLNCPKNKLIFLYIYQNKKIDATKIIKEYIEYSDEDIDCILQTFFTRYNESVKNSNNNQLAKEWQNKPKCPTCGNTNIEKISTTKKMFGGAMFGLFSSNVRNTMHCKNCGYKW